MILPRCLPACPANHNNRHSPTFNSFGSGSHWLSRFTDFSDEARVLAREVPLAALSSRHL